MVRRQREWEGAAGEGDSVMGCGILRCEINKRCNVMVRKAKIDEQTYR